MGQYTGVGSWRAGLAAALLALLVPAAALAQTLEGNLERRHGDVEIPAGVVLRGDVTVQDGNVTVRGKVDGDVAVEDGRAEIYGEVTGDVEVRDGHVTLGPAARVGGRVVIVRGTLDRSPTSQVGGGVEERDGPSAAPAPGSIIIDDRGIRGPGIHIGPEGVYLPGIAIDPEGVRLPGLVIDERGIVWHGRNLFHALPHLAFWRLIGHPVVRLLSWAGLFVVSAIVLLIMPVPLGRMVTVLERQPVRAGLIGLAVWALAGPALILLIFTLIGIPLIPFLVLALAAAKFIGYVAVSLWLGQQLGQVLPGIIGSGDHTRFLQLLAGSLVLALGGMVPGLNALVALVGACLAMGAVWITRFGTQS